MMSQSGDESTKAQSWMSRLRGASGGAGGGSTAPPGRETDEIIAPEKRKAAMSTLDPVEYKWSFWALVLSTVAGVAIPLYLLSQHRVTKKGGHSVAVTPDAALVMAAILLFCALGFLALWKRKRTLVAFSLFLVGFGFTLFVGLLGFVFIAFGGWLMLRAWRINRYGTTNAKAIARETSSRPRGKEARQQKQKPPAKSTVTDGTVVRQPPTASKRYTPKSAPRKKIPKPTQ